MVPATIAADWPRISALLEKAVAVDEGMRMEDVREALMSGHYALFDVDFPRASGVVVVEINRAEVNCFWIVYIGGHISGHKSAWLGRVRVLAHYFEGVARAMNCTEIHIRGRDWSRVFPDWQRVGPRHELVKAL